MTDFMAWFRAGIMSVLRGRGQSAIVLAVSTAGSSVAQDTSRYAAAWQETLEGCMAYVETGSTEVFDGWDVAYPGGGVCNGNPVCEGPEMTFIPVGAAGVGAATVRVEDGPVEDNPGAAVCETPFPAFFPPMAIEAVVREQLSGMVDTRRLIAGESEVAGVERFLGCAYDGREFFVDVFRAVLGTGFRVALDRHAPMCRKVTS